MIARSAPSLTEQRQSIRGQLQKQRQIVSEQLASDIEPQSCFPRSVTMRLLIQQPALLARLASLIPGAPGAGSIPALFAVFQILGSAVAVKARRRNSRSRS